MARKKVNLLPSTERILEKAGANIKKARLRRNIRAELLAERAGISADTLSAIERGVSTVSIGAYAAVSVRDTSNARSGVHNCREENIYFWWSKKP